MHKGCVSFASSVAEDCMAVSYMLVYSLFIRPAQGREVRSPLVSTKVTDNSQGSNQISES